MRITPGSPIRISRFTAGQAVPRGQNPVWTLSRPFLQAVRDIFSAQPKHLTSQLYAKENRTILAKDKFGLKAEGLIEQAAKQQLVYSASHDQLNAKILLILLRRQVIPTGPEMAYLRQMIVNTLPTSIILCSAAGRAAPSFYEHFARISSAADTLLNPPQPVAGRQPSAVHHMARALGLAK